MGEVKEVPCCALCDGRIDYYGEKKVDVVARCRKCESRWTLDSKEENPVRMRVVPTQEQMSLPDVQSQLRARATQAFTPQR